MRETEFIRHGFDVNYLVAEKAEDIVPMIQSKLALTPAHGVSERVAERL
jgi:hypothetical protein